MQPRIGTNFGLSATYSATANVGSGASTAQGFTVLDTYPGRWISVQITGIGTGSAAATFGFSVSNSPTVGFQGSPLQTQSATTTAMQTALSADGILQGPIKARYVAWQSVTAASAGPTATPVTAFVTVWDAPGQTIG